MIDILVTLLIVVLICALIYWVITLIPLPEPFKTIVTVIFALIVVIYLISLLLGGIHTTHPLLR